MHILPSLTSIASRHHSDKGLTGPSRKWNGNNYTDIYEAYFHNFVESPVQLLEIGIGVPGPNWKANISHGENREGGASLKMWHDYFSKGSIYGVDINPADHLENERIKTIVANQGSRSDLADLRRRFGESYFDFIIDDGSHRGDHQQMTLEALWPCLRSGGLYIIEDLNDRGFGERISGRHGSPDTVTTRRLLIEFVNKNTVIEPHAFQETTFFDEFNSVRFHCPRPAFDLSMLTREFVRTFLGRGRNGVSQTRYAEGSYKMVVIQKK